MPKSNTAGEEVVLAENITGSSFTDEIADPEAVYEYTVTGSDGREATVAVPMADESNENIERIDSYVRVTSVAEITDGIYVMTGARQGSNLNKAILSDTLYSQSSLTVTDGVITSEIDDSYKWTITKAEAGYAIRNSNNKYLYIYSSDAGDADAV